MLRQVLFFTLVMCTSITFSQDMKVSWEDDDGREFSIRVLSGRFEYGMIPGDDISYDYMGDNVTKVGTTRIQYDYLGERITKVGDVSIQWDYLGEKITKVGGLTIRYDYLGEKVTGTRGRVRY